MPGLTDLAQLLASASPALQPGRFVFAVVADPAALSALDPVGTFRENEAVTAICPFERAAQAGLRFTGGFRQITLQVHSSLEAVGFLAAVTSALAAAGIPCNAVSAYYHDHLFVPEAQADAALGVLEKLAAQSL